ncbi:hypothetical protein CLM65_11130 [Serratia marcescens]|uniref:hypothetical protein n=1 Tax=Serratia marcescens TaxID=615 RepID=UPI000A16FCAE|nr:hypothetical protein [Serratia marcescens]AWC73607.1 hypothetical protein AM371_01015 [Serratia marcescens]AXH02050.1 phage capsid and scaffold [Serratia marcescens]AXH02725.1 phage capsid and scaffold [Serratia marcescens]EIJ6702005.1 hypothetical protein [Serratia marcescens]EIV5186767.1 hypothetical protein [Serratia marcescens]
MPIVPTYERQSRAEMAPVNQVDIRVPQTGVGEALAQVGGNYLQAFGEEKQKQDLAFAQNAMLQFQTQADDLLNNPQTGLMTKQGANAIGQSEQVIGQLGGLADQAFASIPDGPVKEQFRNQFQAAGQPIANRARQYEIGQRQQFESGQQQGLLANLQQQAENSFDSNEGFVNANLLAREQIMAYGQAHGQSPEEIEANWVSFRENSAKAALNAQLTAGRYDQFLARNGEPSDVGGVSRFTAHGNSSAARGLRNNNPGNIEASDKNPWEGQTGSDGRFAKFETPEHGIRALGKNLLAYQAKGFDTVAEIVNRWAPASDGNNTDAYIKALCGALGVGANDQVDMSNPRTLAALCAGIVKHENGSQPYTDEQIGAGVSAALGLSALESSKRRTGNAAFDAASPATQGAYLRQAQAMQNEQRALYAQQLGTSLKDAYSALDEGLQPAQLPTQADLINAYGPSKGMRQWQDLQDQQSYGGVIGAAKSMSPAARQDLLERLRPTDPNASNFAANQQRWDKMQAKFKQLDAEWEKNQGSARFSSSLQNNFPLDPNDKNNQAAADHYFDQKVAPGFNINNADSLNQVAEITTKSGMLPTQIKTMLTAGATSRDPAVVVPMAKMYGQIFDNNPAAATGVDKGAMAFYSKVYAYDRAGVPAEKAVDMAYNQVYQQDDRLKQMISQQVRDKDYIKDRAKAAQDNINSLSPSWTSFGAPSITAAGQANQLYQRDYQTIYDANFAQTGGDAEQAKAMTNAMIKKVWAVSTINGKEEVMKYAPEAVYGVTNGSGNWIKGQWEEEKKALKSSAFGGMRDDTDLVLVPDAVTPRDQTYSVMVRQKNAEGYDDVRPYYGENGMPLRFRPEQKTSPMYKQTMDIQQKRVDAARAARQEEKQPVFTNQQGYTPPDFTKPFGAGIANQLPSNITAGGQ